MHRSTFYRLCISQLIRFARVSSHVADFNACNKNTLLNFSNRAIGNINFKNLSQSFIADFMNWVLNSRSYYNFFATGPIGSRILL